MLGLDRRWALHARDSPAARNRYIYTGAPSLYRVPGSLGELFSDARFRNSPMRLAAPYMLRAGIDTLLRPPLRGKAPPQDMSVGEVMEFWAGKAWIDQVASAFIRGVTAGDPYKLSMRAFNEKADLWHCERLGAKRGVLKETVGPFEHDDQFVFKQWSKSVGIQHDALFDETMVMYLRGGLGAIPAALETALKLSGNLDVVKHAKVTDLSMTEDGQHVLVRLPKR
jgi:protoporphyrinogen oxidase